MPAALPKPLKPNQDDVLREQRLNQFLRWMLPIAVGFLVTYLACAIWLSSMALAIGSIAVAAYGVALVFAKRALARGQMNQAAQLTGLSLLLMVAVGVVGIPFQFPVLITIPIAAVAVVLPFLRDAQLRRFMLATFGVTVWVTLICLLPPMFEQPPLWFQRATLGSAVLACVGLTLRLLWIDGARLRESLRCAEAAVAVRDDFLLVASHEINTPLTPLSLKLEALLREANASEDSPLRQRVLVHTEVARRQVRKLTGLVGDLLDGSRISVGPPQLELSEVDLVALVRETIARFEPQAAQTTSAVKLECAEPAIIGRWDPRRLEQVMANLMSNALKYGGGTPVTVSIARDGSHAVLKVRDEGIGVPADSLARIFEKYERAVSDRNYGGLGLGLFITRKIVEAHGGTIAVESVAGKGATFIVRLPASAPESSTSSRHRTAPRAAEAS